MIIMFLGGGGGRAGWVVRKASFPKALTVNWYDVNGSEILHIALSFWIIFFIPIILVWTQSVVTLRYFCSHSKNVFECTWTKSHVLVICVSRRNFGKELSRHHLAKFHSKSQKKDEVVPNVNSTCYKVENITGFNSLNLLRLLMNSWNKSFLN